jgi:hypothetical protein
MLGITIRFGATRNDLTTADGQVFDLSGKKGAIAASGVEKFLKSINYFGEEPSKGVDRKKK